MDGQKILIVGGGSIGSVIGALLREYYHTDTIGLLRRKPPFGLIDLQLVGERDLTISITIYNYETVQSFSPDIVLLTVQEQHTDDACIQLLNSGIIRDDTILVSLQNGLSPAKLLCRYFPSNPIIQGIVWWSATLYQQDLILYHRKSPTVLGIPDCSTAESTHLRSAVQLLENILMVEQKNIIADEMYAKYILNVVSPVLALVKDPYPDGVADNSVRNLVHNILDDAIGTAKQLGWQIDNQKLEEFHKMLAGITPVPSSTVSRKYVHKVSTQIGIEKYGGKNSNVSELLALYAETGSALSKALISEIHGLDKEYNAIGKKKIDELLQIAPVHQCILE